MKNVQFPAVENATYARGSIADNRAGEQSDSDDGKERCNNEECIFHYPEVRILARRIGRKPKLNDARAITGDNYDPTLGRGAVKSRKKLVGDVPQF